MSDWVWISEELYKENNFFRSNMIFWKIVCERDHKSSLNIPIKQYHYYYILVTLWNIKIQQKIDCKQNHIFSVRIELKIH